MTHIEFTVQAEGLNPGFVRPLTDEERKAFPFATREPWPKSWNPPHPADEPKTETERKNYFYDQCTALRLERRVLRYLIEQYCDPATIENPVHRMIIEQIQCEAGLIGA